MKDKIQLTDTQLARYEDLNDGYRCMYTNPEQARPKIIIHAPEEKTHSWETCYANPHLMLERELAVLKQHIDLEDDRVLSVRVQFGTAQIAAAFGCELAFPTDSLPAAKNHVLKNAKDVDTLAIPALEAGLYAKLVEYTEVFKQHLPEGVHIQHPDIQGPFNSAHLIRGNDILLDFYDDPESVGKLLDKVTDYMIKLVPWLKTMISDDPDWFFDWGSLWRGMARMCNCSVHMISPAFYREYVMPSDIRLMKAIGGGRMHYCGTYGEVINDYFQVPSINGLDYDAKHHDLWELCDKAPSHLVLFHWIMDRENDTSLERLLRGDWPGKQNIVVKVSVDSMKEGRVILAGLRKAGKATV